MTDKEKLEKVRAEIERLENYEIESVTSSDTRFGWIHGKTFALTSIRVLLDSMQEESVNNGLDLGCGVIWKDEEPVSEDLKQAIDTYLATYFGGEKEKQEWPFLKKMAIHFAEWQKQQMMKDADDYIVDDDNTIKRFYDTGGVVGKPIIFGSTPDSINVGDHVKVIVIKEE